MRETSHQDSDMAPVSFHDVAACFSEEEWKLFNEWQKELYENLMKEIHQALISLGPLIATSVFSLRPKEKEDLFPIGHQDSEIRGSIHCFPCDTITNSDVLLRTEMQGNQYLKAIQDTDQGEMHYCSSTGSAAVAPVSSFSDTNEGETYSMDQQGSDKWQGMGTPMEHMANTSIVSFKIKEEGDSYCVNYQDSKTSKTISTLTEHEASTPVVPLIIKEDGRTYSMNRQVLETRGSIHTPTGKSVAKRRKERDSVKCTEKVLPSEVKSTLFQNSQKTTNCPRQLESESYQEWVGEKSVTWDNVFRKETLSNVHQGAVESVRSDTYNECESNVRSAEYGTFLPTTPQRGRQSTSAECEQSFSLKKGGIDLQGSHSGLGNVNPKQKRHYQSTEYKKIFTRMKTCIGHPRTHFIERPYSCTKCDKRFSQIANRNRHQSTHSEERSYQCSECDKSFNRKDNLIRHQRSHTSVSGSYGVN